MDGRALAAEGNRGSLGPRASDGTAIARGNQRIGIDDQIVENDHQRIAVDENRILIDALFIDFVQRDIDFDALLIEIVTFGIDFDEIRIDFDERMEKFGNCASMPGAKPKGRRRSLNAWIYAF